MDFSISTNHSSLISRVTLKFRPPTHFRFLLLMFFVLISFVFLSISGKQNWEIPVNKMDLRGVEYEKIPDWTLMINILATSAKSR